MAWVSAELAMARGDGAAAVGHAERAVELAAALGSARHAVKSEVVLAAALCCAGDLERPGGSPTPRWSHRRLGLIPLRWALACLLADIGSATHLADAGSSPSATIPPIQCGAGAACGQIAETARPILIISV